MTVAVYCRLSPRPDGSYEGVDRQESWGRSYAERIWPGEPVRVFTDTGISALDPRPGYEALRAAIGAGEVAHLWTVEQSRLERDEQGWFGLVPQLVGAGVTEVHTDRDGIVQLEDVSAGIKAVVNAFERRRLKRRVNDTLASLAAEGRPLGKPSYGYKATTDDDKRAALEVVPAEAEVIRQTADRVLGGWSLSAIARDLEARGVPTRQGGVWSHSNVRGMLTTPIVAGLSVRGGETRPGTWEPIIPVATWRTVVARLSGPKHRPARKYLLSGLAVCGRCGAGLTGRYAKGRNGMRHLYFCHPSSGGCGRLGINAEPVEEYVVGEFLAALDSPEFAAAMAEDDHETRRTELADELERIDAQHVELAARWATGDLPAAAWDQARAALDDRKRRALGDLAAVPAPPVAIDPATIRRGWNSMTMDERRAVLDVFVARVVVAPATPGARSVDVERVSIEWS